MNRNEIDEFIEDNFGPHDKLTILELVDEVKKDAIHAFAISCPLFEEKDGLMVCHKEESPYTECLHRYFNIRNKKDMPQGIKPCKYIENFIGSPISSQHPAGKSCLMTSWI